MLSLARARVAAPRHAAEHHTASRRRVRTGLPHIGQVVAGRGGFSRRHRAIRLHRREHTVASRRPVTSPSQTGQTRGCGCRCARRHRVRHPSPQNRASRRCCGDSGRRHMAHSRRVNSAASAVDAGALMTALRCRAHTGTSPPLGSSRTVTCSVPHPAATHTTPQKSRTASPGRRGCALCCGRNATVPACAPSPSAVPRGGVGITTGHRCDGHLSFQVTCGQGWRPASQVAGW